jgi:hypothetical protein
MKALMSGQEQDKAEGDRHEDGPFGGREPERAPPEQRNYACGQGLGMMFRNTSKKFEELPPGLV